MNLCVDFYHLRLSHYIHVWGMLRIIISDFSIYFIWWVKQFVCINFDIVYLYLPYDHWLDCLNLQRIQHTNFFGDCTHDFQLGERFQLKVFLNLRRYLPSHHRTLIYLQNNTNLIFPVFQLLLFFSYIPLLWITSLINRYIHIRFLLLLLINSFP